MTQTLLSIYSNVKQLLQKGYHALCGLSQCTSKEYLGREVAGRQLPSGRVPYEEWGPGATCKHTTLRKDPEMVEKSNGVSPAIFSLPLLKI